MNYNFGDIIEKVALSFGIKTCFKCQMRKAKINMIGKVIEEAVKEPDLIRRKFLLKTAAAGIVTMVGIKSAWAVNMWQYGCGCIPAPIDIFNCAGASKVAVRFNYAGGPQPSTNGCTGFPDGFWGGCCDQHDFDFANCGMSMETAGQRFKDCIDNKCAENSPTLTLYVSCLAMSKSMKYMATDIQIAKDAYIKEQGRVCGCKPCGWSVPCDASFTNGAGGRPLQPLPGLDDGIGIGGGGL